MSERSQVFYNTLFSYSSHLNLNLNNKKSQAHTHYQKLKDRKLSERKMPSVRMLDFQDSLCTFSFQHRFCNALKKIISHSNFFFTNYSKRKYYMCAWKMQKYTKCCCISNKNVDFPTSSIKKREKKVST